jgi:hypothetical protein
MSLKLTYYGQNDSVNCTPAVALTGDPGTDQQTLTAAGYLGGIIVGLITANQTINSVAYVVQSANEPAFGSVGNIVPCDSHVTVPFATLLNGPGEFAGAIGPSGSKKAPVVRALWQGNVDNQAYDFSAGGAADGTVVVGAYVYCGTGANTGKYTSIGHSGTSPVASGAGNVPVGICTHVPTTTEPWLGVASLL